MLYILSHLYIQHSSVVWVDHVRTNTSTSTSTVNNNDGEIRMTSFHWHGFTSINCRQKGAREPRMPNVVHTSLCWRIMN